MKDERKTKAELIREIRDLRRQVADLKARQIPGADDEGPASLANPGIAYRLLIQNAHTPIVILSRNGVFMDVNPAAASLVIPNGTPEDIVGKSLYDILPRDIADRYIVRLETICDTGEGRLHEYVVPLPQGKHWFLVDSQPVYTTDGDILGVYAVVHDITPHKQVEKRLSEFGRILDDSLNEIYLFDAETLYFLYANRGARNNLGYSLAEIQQLTPLDLKPEFTPETFTRLLAPLRTGEKPRLEFSTYHLRKDGTTYPVEVHLQMSTLEERPMFVAIILDISERVRIENALRKSRQILLEVQRIARLGSWEWDIVANDLHWSDEIYRIFGEPPQSFPVTYETFLARVHPDDREIVQGAVEAALSGQKSYNIEHRIVRPDGEVRIVHERAEVIFDSPHQPVRMVGTVQDITARKETEEELYKLSNVVRQAADSVIITNKAGVIEYVNPAFEQMTGYTAREAIGQTPRFLKSGKHTPDFYNTMWRTILDGRMFRTSVINRKKNGELYYEDKIITPLKNSRGEVTHFVSTGRDITPQRRMEQALRTSEMQHRRIAAELQALYDISLRFNARMEISELLELLTNQLMRLLNADGAGFYVYNPEQRAFHFVGGAGCFRKGTAAPLSLDEGVTPEIFHAPNALSVSTSRSKTGTHGSQKQPSYCTAMLAVPLFGTTGLLGVLNVGSLRRKSDFTPHDAWLAELFAAQAAVALENIQLYQAEKARYQEADTLRRSALALISTLNLEQVIDHILTEMAKVVPYDSASVQLLENEDVRVIGARGFPNMSDVIEVRYSTRGDTPNGLVLSSQAPVIIDDVRREYPDYFLYGPQAPAGTQSWLGVPMMVEDQLIGMLTLNKKQPGFYTAAHARIAAAYAAQAAIAINNARLHVQTKRHANQLAVLYELDRAITSTLKLDQIYRAFAYQAGRLIPCDQLSITLIEDDKPQVVFTTPENSASLSPGTVFSPPESSTNWATILRQPIIRHNLTAEIAFPQEKELADRGFKSIMITPLRVKNKIIGTWNVASRQIGAYTADDLFIAQSMADQLAVAIENARLYRAEREQYRRLQQSQAQLVQAEKMAALGRLTAAIGHEINNPMQAIQNALELLEHEIHGPQRPDRLQRYLQIANNGIEGITEIMSRLRNFYRPLVQQTRPPEISLRLVDDFYRLTPEELQPVNLHELLENVLHLTNRQLRESNITIETVWDTSPAPVVQANPEHLKQVFLNLILNARDAMAGQGGTLSVHITPVSDEQVIRIEFTDTGDGIPANVLPKIFDPFFTTKQTGSGLGLATCYRIIHAHRGEITVESQPGSGATFAIILPLSRQE